MSLRTVEYTTNENLTVKHYLISLFACLLGTTAVQSETALFIEQLNDPNPRIREKAAFLMGKEDSPEAVNALATRLKDPQETLAVKLEIVTSLALIGSQSSFSILVNILKETEMQQPVTRALAAAALGAWREQKGLDPLLETLEDEKEPIVQWKILNALRKIGTDRGTILIEQFTQPFHPTYIREEAEGILNLSE